MITLKYNQIYRHGTTTKNAIITGAGRHTGIGSEICRKLAKSGINIFFTSCRDYDAALLGIGIDEYEAILSDCKNFGVKCFFQSYDLSNNKGICNLFTDAKEKLGNI